MTTMGTATPNTSQLSALTCLFSSVVFRNLATTGRSATFARLLHQTGVAGRFGADATVGDAFEAAFAILKRSGLRDEYIYRAALIQKVLIGKHSLQTASMLTEFRAGECKADLVILNGTATVYEIKSERDSLARLPRQLANYKKVFATVNVIASERHVADVVATVPEDIGVMCLTRRHRISVIRDAAELPDRVCPITIFESLRSTEAITILKALGVPIPNVPNTLRHAAMRERFADLRPTDVHAQMVSALKHTRNLAPLSHLVDSLPQSLHAAALSIQVPRRDHHRLVEAVATPLRTAISWG